MGQGAEGAGGGMEGRGELRVGAVLGPVGQHLWIPGLGNSQSVELLGSSPEGRSVWVGRDSCRQVNGTGA